MKNPFVLTALGVLLFLIFLIAKLPAAQVIPRLPLPDNIVISGVSGTIWEGNADQFIYKGLLISDADWRLSFLPLLLGKASFEVDAGSQRDPDQISIKGNIGIKASGVFGDTMKIYAPAPLLLASVQLPVPVSASGRVVVDINQVDYGFEGCQSLSGKGQWLKGTVAGLQQQIALGDFEASLTCENGPIMATTDPNNMLDLTGTATIPHRGRIVVTGTFRIPPDLPDEVRAAASFFSNINSQGIYTINIQ